MAFFTVCGRSLGVALLFMHGFCHAAAFTLSDYYHNMSDYDRTYYVGQVYSAYIEDLHPSQAVISVEEGQDRVVRVKRKMLKGNEKLISYLEDHVAEVVIGPHGLYFLVDGHHLAWALHEAGVEEILVRVKANKSDLNFEEFFKWMEDQKLIWLYDENGLPIPPTRIPNHVWDLKNDPYRGLSWRLREAHAYRNNNVPMSEFIWSRGLRAVVPIQDLKRAPQRALKLALNFAHSEKAHQLPGFIPRRRAICVNGVGGE